MEALAWKVKIFTREWMDCFPSSFSERSCLPQEESEIYSGELSTKHLLPNFLSFQPLTSSPSSLLPSLISTGVRQDHRRFRVPSRMARICDRVQTPQETHQEGHPRTLRPRTQPRRSQPTPSSSHHHRRPFGCFFLQPRQRRSSLFDAGFFTHPPVGIPRGEQHQLPRNGRPRARVRVLLRLVR